MDKKNISLKIKKYLFFMSIVFLLFTTSHLIYSYIYNGSKEIAKKGGVISEAIIGDFPHLNPLKTDNDYNDYINHMLYRSLLTYNITEEKIKADIANCDISNLTKIECFINENANWSDGTKISIDDVIGTYEKIKATNINPILKSILSEITIEKTNSSIVFKSNKKDINILNIFFQPIVSTKILNTLNAENINSNFSTVNGIYSGNYVVNSISKDETLGITKLILDKNIAYYENNAYIDKIILKIFTDNTHFLKHKDSINIFHDKDKLIGDSVAKLSSYKYFLPQYISLFINYETVPYPNIRNNILSIIDNKQIVEELGTNDFKVVNSPFLNNLNLDIKTPSSTIPDLLESIGYYKKDKALEKYNSNIQNTNTENKQVNKQSENNKTEEINITKDNYLKKSILIYSPDWMDNYNYISKDDILIKGRVNEGIKAVYINDYKLNGFKAGDSEFSYKLSTSLGTMRKGKNIYNIFFETDSKKTQVETIVIYFGIEKEIAENEVLTTLINKKLEENKKQALEEARKQEEESKKKEEKEKEAKQIKAKLENLDSKFYYNSKLEPFSLKLAYIKNNKSVEQTAEIIKEKLEKQAIKIEPVGLDVKELNSILAAGEKPYDLFITGINLSYTPFNLFPYLHSSQVKNGYNFAKFKDLHLDKILEDLKSNNYDLETQKKEEQKILYNLNKEFIMKPLYTPLYSILIDKSIIGYDINSTIPNNIYRFDPIIKSYILKEKILDNTKKGFTGFFKYLISTLF